MFGLFKKSQEEVATALFIAADEFDRKMVECNFLHLAPGSLSASAMSEGVTATSMPHPLKTAILAAAVSGQSMGLALTVQATCFAG